MDKIDLSKWIVKDLRRNSYSFQFEEFIIEKIKSHALHPGEEIPSVRELAKINSVNKNTVHLVYNKLISKGWLTYSHGSRTKVSSNYPNNSRFEEESPHLTNIPDYLQPDAARIKKLWPAPIQNFISIGPQTLNESCCPDTLISKYAKKFREQRIDSTQAQKVSEERCCGLTESVLEHLNLSRGFHTQNSNLHIIKGRSESIKNIFHLLFTSNDTVVNTSPADLLINWILKEGSVKTINIDLTDTNFIRTLKSTIKRQMIRAVYVRPGCTYPKGKSLDGSICFELIELAKKYHFLIIEEDDDHEFWYENAPFKPLITYPNDGHVVYTGALSRLSANLQTYRTVVAPSQIVSLLAKLPISVYEYRDTSEELAIAQILRSGELALLSRKARKLKEYNLTNMHNIFQDHLKEYVRYEMPANGLSIWLEFVPRINLVRLLNHLSRAGIQVPYYPEKQRHLPTIYNMRLDFSYFQESECKQAAIMIEKIYARLIKPTG